MEPGAKDARPWSVDDLKAAADPMNEPSWVKDIGRGLTIGSLYDIRSDQPVPGYLFTKDAIDGKTRRVDTPYTALEMASSDRLKDKFTLANVETSLAISIMVMGVEIETGATAKYLNDKKQSQKTSRVSMNYMTRSHMEHLDLYDERLKHHMFHEPITNGLATHVVTGVLWGGNCYAIFEADSDNVEAKQETEASLKNMVKVNTPLFGFKSDFEMSSKFGSTYKEVYDKTTVRIYGDHVPHDRIPTEVNEALEYIQKIPEEIAKAPVPIAVQLFPLSKLDARAARLRQQVSDYAIDSAMELFMEIDELELMVKDLTVIKEDGFVLWKENVLQYLADLQAYRLEVVLRLGAELKSIRDGIAPQDRLLVPVREHAHSDFSTPKVTNRVRIFSDQIYNLKAWVKVLVDDGVHIAYSFSDFTSKTFDADYTDVYALIFRGMNPSADRASSKLLRRFRSFAAKRRPSKAEAFVFVHYDSFAQQFGIEAAMSSENELDRGGIAQLQLRSGIALGGVHGSSNGTGFEEAHALGETSESFPGWSPSASGGFVHGATGIEQRSLDHPHAFPPDPRSADGSIAEAISGHTYTELPGTTWLEGHADGRKFYWEPAERRFSWLPPASALQQRARSTSRSAELRHGQEQVAAARHDFQEAKRLRALARKEERSVRVAEDLEARIALAASASDYDRAAALESELQGFRAAQALAADEGLLPSSCTLQGLHLEALGCQALLPPQCRVAGFGTPSQRCADNATAPCERATFPAAERRLETAECQEIWRLLPAPCLDVGISSESCREPLPDSCLGDTLDAFDRALASEACKANLTNGASAAQQTCSGSGCECGLWSVMPDGICCERRSRRTRPGSRAGSAYCIESPCRDGQFWCEQLAEYMTRNARSPKGHAPGSDLNHSSHDGHVLEGSCVSACTTCAGNRRQAINAVCEHASPELCYWQAGGLLFCPPSGQCMASCAACVGFESEDPSKHTCSKKPSPDVCFLERGGMLFCPSDQSCVELEQCRAACLNNPKRDYVRRQCSTGATLATPLTVRGTPSRDRVRVEFEAQAPAGENFAYASIMVLPRSYSETITASLLWRLARAASHEGSLCVVAGQPSPLTPHLAAWILEGCHLEVETQYNLWLALSDNRVDATDALLAAVPLRVPQPIAFASQATATLDPMQGRVTVRFLVESSRAAGEMSTTSGHSLLGWSWLLPSRLAACCLDTASARLEPGALKASLLASGLEMGEGAVLDALLACSVRGLPVQEGTPAAWTMNCPEALQRARDVGVALGVRVLVAEDEPGGDGGTLTATMPMVQPPPCATSDVSVRGGSFGCSHLESVDDGTVCEVVPDAIPGRCTHDRLSCRGGQWATCASGPEARVESHVFEAGAKQVGGPEPCTITTFVSCMTAASTAPNGAPLGPLGATQATEAQAANEQMLLGALNSVVARLAAVANGNGGSNYLDGITDTLLKTALAVPGLTPEVQAALPAASRIVDVVASKAGQLASPAPTAAPTQAASSVNESLLVLERILGRGNARGGAATASPFSLFQIPAPRHGTAGLPREETWSAFVLRNVHSGRKMYATATELGATMDEGGPEQVWWLDHHPTDGSVAIVNVYSKRRLRSAVHMNFQDGFWADASAFGQNPDEYWWIERVTENSWHIVGKVSNRALYARKGYDRVEERGAYDGFDWGKDTEWYFDAKCTAFLHGGEYEDGWHAALPEGLYNKRAIVKAGALSDARSITVFGVGCSATLYEGPGFDGSAFVLPEGSYNWNELAERGAGLSIGSVRVMTTTTTTTTTVTTSTGATTTTTAVEFGGEPCAADHGAGVGDAVCCGQEGVVDEKSQVCPDPRAPQCVGFVHGTTWGRCQKRTTTPRWPTTSTTTQVQATTTSTTTAVSWASLEYGVWGSCSRRCGDDGFRERALTCYKDNQRVALRECGATKARACGSGPESAEHVDDVDEVGCEVEVCNRMRCVDLDPEYNESKAARERYSRKRCLASAEHGRSMLKLATTRAKHSHAVNPMRCAEACRWTPGCVFFTVLRTEGVLASLPWCYQEDAATCELEGGRGIVADDAWDLYRLSEESPANRTGNMPAPHRKGVITRTVVWHYRESALVDEDFVPPYVPDAPSAPAAVARGTTAGSEVDRWVRLSWDAPAETNGAEVLFYRVRRTWWQASYEAADGAQGERQLSYRQITKISESRSSQTRDVLVSGLQAGRTYSFEVAAVNSEGDSEWSPKSAPIRMGAAAARAEPKAATWTGGDAVTLTLSVAAETPVDHVVVTSEADGRIAACVLVATEDPFSRFTCLAPAWAKLGSTPAQPGTAQMTSVVAYDASGFDIATASLKYADFTCPMHADLREIATADGDETECAWFREQGMPNCEVCECSEGYRKNELWSRGRASVGGEKIAPASSSGGETRSSEAFSQVPDDAAPAAGDATVPGGSARKDDGPPRYSSQSACVEVGDYCKALDLSFGRLPDQTSPGLAVHGQVADVREVCDPGYELSTEEGLVQQHVECLPDTDFQGRYGVLGRPRTFICTEVDRFCTKQAIPGGEIPFATVREIVDVSCKSPARDSWPYNDRGTSSRLACVAFDGSRARGKFVTEDNEDASGIVRCAGCPRAAIESDGQQGWISAARIGQRGKMHCPAGWVLAEDFRGMLGPLCTAEAGERVDNLLGKWNLDDWMGKRPRCVFEDKCKSVDCGKHGVCVIQDEEVQGGTHVEAVTWKKKVAKCMCTGGYHGERCERAPPMKCEYQIRYEKAWAQHQPITQTIRPQLVEASQNVVTTYKQLLGGDVEVEEQVVKALMTRTARLNNVRVCCVKLDHSVSYKGGGFTRVQSDEFATSIDNVQITTAGTGIDDAVRELMTEASISLATKARETVRQSGLSDHQVSVAIQSVTADIEMPVGLPPEGACMAVQ